jgi:surface carbohydrate biosynthesis protein
MFSFLKQLINSISFKFFIKQVDAVIYFKNEQELMKKWILDPIGLKSTTVRDPMELIINLKVIFYFIKNIKYIFGKKFVRRARFTYEKSLIQLYNPKIVITFIDNSSFISEVSKIDNKRPYFAIQNGTRFDYNVEDIPKSVFKEINNKTLNYFTWGKYSEDIYNKHSDYKCYFIPVGSFRHSISGYYPTTVPELENKKFDICMVSTVNALSNYDLVRVLYDKVKDDEWNETNSKISRYLKKYIKEKNKSLIISLRGHSEFEINLYNSIFDKEDNVFILPRGEKRTVPFDFNTYDLINKSDLIISFASSTTVEALALDKRVIQIDYSINKQYFINYSNSIWQLSDSSYEAFSECLDYIIKIDNNTYSKAISDYKSYMIEYDSKEPSYLKIQNEIKSRLI